MFLFSCSDSSKAVGTTSRWPCSPYSTKITCVQAQRQTERQMLNVKGGAATPPKGGLATLPTTPPPLVGGSAREVSDLAVSLNVVGVGVGVGAQW